MNDNLQNSELTRILKEPWYHSLELLPTVFTNGTDHANIAITRALLCGCEIEDMKCLDIGAEDFLITLLLLRRRANVVAAYDRKNKKEKADFLKTHFHVNFEYISGIHLSELSVKTRKLSISPFDVVIFSGVLYHMLAPLSGLALVRGLVRNGGLLVIETATVVSKTIAMYFNAKGRFYSHTTYWQISVECLDYLLRFLKLAPIDCLYLGRPETLFPDQPTERHVARVGIVCRAVEDCLPSEDDQWMSQALFDRDFCEFLDWNRVVTNLPAVQYKIQNPSLVMRQDTQTVDIFRTIEQNRPLVIKNPDRQIRLQLSAQY